MGWFWIALGIGLAAVEMMLPTYLFLLALGAAALAVGLLTLTGVITGWGSSVGAFCGFSVVAAAVFFWVARRHKGSVKRSNVEELIGKTAVVRAPLGGPASPQGYLVVVNREEWSARAAAGAGALAAGEQVRVVSVDGVHLIIEKGEARRETGEAPSPI